MGSVELTRRQALAALMAAPAAGLLDFPDAPIRCLTRGPRHHWFGYYDKLQFDPSGRFVLGMETAFEHRSPRADDVIQIGMIDTARDDHWTELGASRAWGWQQGCMLQWRPGSETDVLWNDREDDRFVCRVLNTKSWKRLTLDAPVYTVSPDGRSALGLDFSRVNDMRPGYGYAGLVDGHKATPAPERSGVTLVDLESGASRLVLSLAAIVRGAGDDKRFKGAKHWVNHILWSPSGERFVVLHRWRRGRAGFRTRMLTARADGSDIRLIDNTGHTSHFIWRDDGTLLVWTRHPKAGNGFWLIPDQEGGPWKPVGAGIMTRNGHCTYLPRHPGWIVNDTYPDKNRKQHVYLFHQPKGRVLTLGRFTSPKEYRGEWRCDTHPRSSPDGTKIVIDSPHGGAGRQLWMIDVAGIVE